MTYRLVVRRQAKADIREGARWYESQRAGLGRAFVLLVALLLLAAPLGAEAQQAKEPYRIGFLATSPPEGSKVLLDAFLAGLRQYGYFEGRNLGMPRSWSSRGRSRRRRPKMHSTLRSR